MRKMDLVSEPRVFDPTEALQSLPGHPFTDAERERRGQLTVIVCPPEEDKARQEFAQQVDINRVVNQFGQNFHAMTPVSGFDQDLDLQGAFAARAAAADAWERIPLKVRERFPSWAQLMAADKDGSLAAFLKPAEPPASSPPAV